AAGFLTGKYRRKEDIEGASRGYRVGDYMNDKGFRILAALDEISVEADADPATIALAWLIRKPGLTAPIASATSLSQLETMIEGTRLELSKDQMALLDDAGA